MWPGAWHAALKLPYLKVKYLTLHIVRISSLVALSYTYIIPPRAIDYSTYLSHSSLPFLSFLSLLLIEKDHLQQFPSHSHLPSLASY